MTTIYTEVVGARIAVEAKDAVYSIQFDEQKQRGKSWEFDSMSDAIQTEVKRTGKMRVRFAPVESSMVFPEDAKRRKEYLMDIADARELWKLAHKNTYCYWYVLDLAHEAEKGRFMHKDK